MMEDDGLGFDGTFLKIQTDGLAAKFSSFVMWLVAGNERHWHSRPSTSLIMGAARDFNKDA